MQSPPVWAALFLHWQNVTCTVHLLPLDNFTAKVCLCSGRWNQCALKKVTIDISPSLAWPLTQYTLPCFLKEPRWWRYDRLYYSHMSLFRICNILNFVTLSTTLSYLSKHFWGTVWLINIASEGKKYHDKYFEKLEGDFNVSICQNLSNQLTNWLHGNVKLSVYIPHSYKFKSL